MKVITILGVVPVKRTEFGCVEMPHSENNICVVGKLIVTFAPRHDAMIVS